MTAVEFEELDLRPRPDEVPRAREAAQLFVRRVEPDLAEAAALVVTELVTNALLHGEAPCRLRLVRRPFGVRVEVEDCGRDVPQPAGYGEQAVTGRGIGLVSALSRSWGVEASERGKVVWAEIDGSQRSPAAPGELDVDVLVRTWAPEDPEPLYTVRLGDVPTNLLLDAKSHVDNLVRELTLAAGGAENDDTGLPRHLAQMVEGVVHRFSAARVAIRRQALEAAARGAPVTRLTLTLPASTAEAGEQYLAALDQADRYARAARLLTLATPPTHRVFRRWYVETLVTELRARASGRIPPPPVRFEERLVEEFDAMAGVSARASRIARLQAVTAALAEATTEEEATRVLLVEGVAALGASGGSVLVVNERGVMVPATVGYSDELILRLAAERPGDNLPATTAARTGVAVWIESPEDRNALFPDMVGLEPETSAICAVPLVLGGRVLGALRFSFDQPHLFDDEEREFVEALAAQAMLALQRSELYGAEREARRRAEQLAVDLAQSAQRLRLLQRATAELTTTHDVVGAARVVVDTATEGDAGADTASVFLCDGERDELVRVASRGPAGESAGWGAVALDETGPLVVAMAERRIVALEDPCGPGSDFPQLHDRYPSGMSLLVAPLVVGDHRLGALHLGFHRERKVEPAIQVSFLTALADACAQAIDRAEATSRAAETALRLTYLADASVVLSSQLDIRDVLADVARLTVSRLAELCVLDVALLDDDGPVVAASDPATVAKVRATLRHDDNRSSTVSPGDDGLPGRGGSVFASEGDADGASRAASGGVRRIPARYGALASAVGASSTLAVPVRGRSGSLGWMVVAHTSPAERFSDEDVALMEDLGHRVALAVETATEQEEQRGRLAALTRVAETAQLAILAPPPPRVGHVDLAARYVSAAAEARIGGDLYEVVARDDSVRLLVGDVRGKGLDAVRTATVVLGEFRTAADEADLATLARQLDTRLSPYLDDEDFVTAVLAEIDADGALTVACCGHPRPFLVRGGDRREVGAVGSLPLGLGADPTVVTDRMQRGDRLLLYTDGLLEARRPQGGFIDPDALVGALSEGSVHDALDRLLKRLRRVAGADLGDDLALVLAEYRPRPN